jgi:crotonobetainyl-CoA:carnitine CoA-transferase CaiB-like acyl-CoA transferase
MPKALEGIRVLDLTQALNGPFCCMLLGHLGAEVIKVEHGAGDNFRKIWLTPEVAAQRDSYEFLWVNVNKKGITLNLRTEKGKEIFTELVKQSDVVVENFSAGTLERLGFSYDMLRSINPRIIYACGTGFGLSGPNVHRHAAANVAMAMGGWTAAAWRGDEWWHDQGDPEPGTKVRGPGDEACGVSLAVGILGALFFRERTGKGQMIEVSMQEAILGFSISQLHEFFEQQPIGARPEECADGYYSFTGVFAGDQQWKTFCTIMGREELIDDPRYSSASLRRDNAADIRDLVRAWMKTKTRQELWEALEPLEAVNGPVLNYAEVLEDPHMRARGAWVDVEHATAPTFPMLRPWILMSESPTSIEHPAPLLGEHNEDVYCGLLGYSKEQVAELKQQGVI